VFFSIEQLRKSHGCKKGALRFLRRPATAKFGKKEAEAQRCCASDEIRRCLLQGLKNAIAKPVPLEGPGWKEPHMAHFAG
jgi:hypothetical protein